MEFKLLISPKANSFLKKLDKKNHDRLRKKFYELKINPELGKPLTGKLAGLWSLRAGDYRAIYQIRQGELVILILRIGHRKNIY
jgi:mRNA interferase RelE/StbE